MKTSESQVTCVVITDSKHDDLVRVFLSDPAPKHGQVTIEAFGEAWSHYWPAMWDGYNAASFFCRCDDMYLFKKFAPDVRACYERDIPELKRQAQRGVCEQRRERHINRLRAKELWDEIEGIADDDPLEMSGDTFGLMEECLPEGWFMDIPQRMNGRGLTLLSVLQATRDGLCHHYGITERGREHG